MGRTLILTDDAGRGERLARHLQGADVAVHDLYGDARVPAGCGLVIGDVSAVTSESILRLRRALGACRGADTPFLYLVHGNLERGEIQATALGATRALPASVATAMLLNAVAALRERPAARAADDLRGVADAACAIFTAVFADQGPPPAAVVEAGTVAVNRAIREASVRDWLAMVARFDDTTHRHCLTVAGLAAAFGQRLGLNDADAARLTRGALLHDVGKAMVSLAILNKPGPLTPEERVEMERHPVFGHTMLRGEQYDPLTLAVVRSHHEYLDGTGYPDGLSARQIPDLVRLVTICDIFTALIERRPYKAPKTAEQSYAILRGLGGRLDQDLVRAFDAVATACAEPDRQACA